MKQEEVTVNPVSDGSASPALDLRAFLLQELAKPEHAQGMPAEELARGLRTHGVSRTEVSAALRELAKEGLVRAFSAETLLLQHAAHPPIDPVKAVEARIRETVRQREASTADDRTAAEELRRLEIKNQAIDAGLQDGLRLLRGLGILDGQNLSVGDGQDGRSLPAIDAVDLDQARRDQDRLGAVGGDEDVDKDVAAAGQPEVVRLPSDEVSGLTGPLPPSARGGGLARQDFGGSIDDGCKDQPFGEFLDYHERLLKDGWRPTRWRHPVKGDLELVLPDAFWISRLLSGQILIHFRLDRAAAAFKAGRTEFARDDEGNLIVVAPSAPKAQTP